MLRLAKDMKQAEPESAEDVRPSWRKLALHLPMALYFTPIGAAVGAAYGIDHFERFNDTCGHRRGDELLGMVAAEFRGLARKPDFVARYGGHRLRESLSASASRRFPLTRRTRLPS